MSEALQPVAWQYTTESGNEHYTSIKAKALQFDANPMPLYAAPPSTAEKCYVCGGNDGIRGKHGIYCERTIIEGRFPWKPSTAEAQARALEDAADDMAKSRYAALYAPAIRLLRVRAKRIREEG